MLVRSSRAAVLEGHVRKDRENGAKKGRPGVLEKTACDPILRFEETRRKGASRRFPVTKITNQALSGALHESARAATIDGWVLQDSGKGKPAALQNATPKGTK